MSFSFLKCWLCFSPSERFLAKGNYDRMQVEPALAGSSGSLQDGIGPQGPALESFLIVEQNKLHQARQWNIHIVALTQVAVAAALADDYILSAGSLDCRAQRHP